MRRYAGAVTPAVDEELACMRIAELRGVSGWWRAALTSLRLESVHSLFLASEDELAATGLTRSGISALQERSGFPALARRREQYERAGISIAAFGSSAYPARLRAISDPPPLLFYCGAAPAQLTTAVAVVGSRRPTRYGRRVATRIGGELAAAGVTVVSGMAYGIDACAHEGALRGGASAAVLACGLDRPYPRGHRALFEALKSSAGVVSEHPPGVPAWPSHFPARNRIVTGMCAAVVVVEATERSGSLVSARLALEQGRDLFAVPGNIDSPTSAGTNSLLRDGCAPYLELADVLAAIGVPRRAAKHVEEAASSPSLDGEAAKIVAVLESEPAELDAVIEACGLDGARVLELLTGLELAGLVERSAGGRFSRTASATPLAGGSRDLRGA